MHEEHDIVARVSSGQARTSTGALAAYLGRSCGHVSLDERILAQGYRFYPWMSDEIPHFFNKRFTTGSVNLAITLQAGFNIEGDDPFDGCASNGAAKQIIASPDYESSLWLARITIGAEMFHVAQISEPIFVAKHPNEFRLIAEELVSLGVLQGHSCPMCCDDGSND